MGHVKVVRRSMLPDEWTDIRIRSLRRLLIKKRYEITGWTIREGRQIGDNSYEMYDDVPRALNRGDVYFTPDGTAFMHAEASLPDDFAGEEVRLHLATAAEMLVRVNGNLQGGIDPNRETMPLPPSSDGRYIFDIEGYNRSKPDDDRNEETTKLKGCRQIFQGACFVVLNKDATELFHDVSLFRDIVRGGQFDEDYSQFVSDRLYHALSMVDYESASGLCEAKMYIEKELYGNQLYRGVGRVELIAHSHLDIAYYWQRKHAIQKNARTCLIQLELMERYPFLRYTHTQAYLFETLQKYYPDLFERVKKYSEEGRFEPVGAMYVESDCNIPSAESLTRQFLYGQRYFRENFGKYCNNCWLPDVFGNSAVLPQILEKSNVGYFVSNKMSTWNDTNRFPHNSFIWKGLDGSQVYACVPPTHFITAATPTEIMQNWSAYQDKDSGAATLCMYGYGDGGSGVTEEMLQTIERLCKVSAMPQLEMTGAEEYLQNNLNEEKKLSVWDGELYLEMHRGTYTTKADLKKNNRELEFLLRDTELKCAAEWINGTDYPYEKITGLWKKLLINQFHDILPGSHIHPVYEDAMADYQQIRNECMELIKEENGAFYNTLPFERKHPVFVAGEGKDVHLNVHGRYMNGNMPSMCKSVLSPAGEDTEWFAFKTSECGSILLTTSVLTVTILPDGSFSSVQDPTGREYVNGSFNILRLFQDVPGNYDAWDILPTYREVEIKAENTEPIHFVYADGITCVFECVLSTRKSVITRRIRFMRDQNYVETEHHVSWHEEHVMLKAEFEINVRAPYAVCDLGAGFINRETNRNTTWQQARYEVCHHKWCDMSETNGGVAVVNHSKYGIGIQDNRLSLSLLRSTCRPDLISDRGEHDFAYLTVFHSGNCVSAGINRLAFEYNVPLRHFVLPQISLPEGEGLFLQAMKVSEDGNSLILRFTEQDGCRGILRLPYKVKLLNLLEDEIEETDCIAYHPFEMLTLGLTRKQAQNLFHGEGLQEEK